MRFGFLGFGCPWVTPNLKIDFNTVFFTTAEKGLKSNATKHVIYSFKTLQPIGSLPS